MKRYVPEISFYPDKQFRQRKKITMNNFIKSELTRLRIDFKFEDGMFYFPHPKYPELVDCIVNVDNGKLRFIADYELIAPAGMTEEQLCAILNKLNYANDFGNLETDGNGLIVFKLNAFLPDCKHSANEVCRIALIFFLQKISKEFRKLEDEVNKIRRKIMEVKAC